jgi:2-polyprenyl-3-methyl-5-hydroxy-6-metoxy-1,4-benzoquinol methylase
MTTTILKHDRANVYVAQLHSGNSRIHIELTGDQRFSAVQSCETSYPIGLIAKLLDSKGPEWLCDEILRDESPDYVQKPLKYALLGYQAETTFHNKRLLDFGCGSGASTMILARMLPFTEIVGIEMEEKLLSIARLRAAHYGYNNITLTISPNPDSLPQSLGHFDFVVLNAVYEHLLPNERESIIMQIWNRLKPAGILFLNETPYRYFPVETHTTGGLPLINYLPDRAALFYARHFSRRKLKSCSWDELLRQGIRGGTVRTILNVLARCGQRPILLNPSRCGMKDRIDLWFIQCGEGRHPVIKRLYRLAAKVFKSVTGVIILPTLSIALKKGE